MEKTICKGDHTQLPKRITRFRSFCQENMVSPYERGLDVTTHYDTLQFYIFWSKIFGNVLLPRIFNRVAEE